MVKFKAKPIVVGNSYAVIIPKAFFTTGTLNINDEIQFKVIEDAESD